MKHIVPILLMRIQVNPKVHKWLKRHWYKTKTKTKETSKKIYNKIIGVKF